MKPTLSQQFDVWARGALPVALSLILALFSAVLPLGLSDFTRIVPALNLMAVFYWSIYRPDLTPPWAVFVIGVVQDVIGGVPLGLNTVTFLIAHGIVSGQRAFFLGKPFVFTWLGFAVVALTAMFGQWVIVCAMERHVLQLRPVLFQALMTIAVFPCLAWTFVRLHRYLLR